MKRRKEDSLAADEKDFMEKYLFVYHTQTLMYSLLGDSERGCRQRWMLFGAMDAEEPDEQMRSYRAMVQFQNPDAETLRVLTFHFLRRIRRMKKEEDQVRAYEVILAEMLRIRENRILTDPTDRKILDEEIEHAERCRDRILRKKGREEGFLFKKEEISSLSAAAGDRFGR